MKPGVERQTTAVLPQASAVARTVSTTSGALARPRTTSTSAITGAGLKKCMPTSRSGCFSPAASAVIDSDEVLLAKIASLWQITSRVWNRRPFAAGSSAIASIRRPAAVNASRLSQRVMRPRVRSRSSGAQATFVDRVGERSGDALFGLRQRGLFGVVKEHAVAGSGRDLRDAGAHGAGTHYGDGNSGRKRHAQRPRNVGWRLAMNAATPSR